MELQYFGANCIKVVTKRATLVIDDNLADLGLKSVTKTGDISLYTGLHAAPLSGAALVIDYPGEYEVSDISLQGVAARSHTDTAGQVSATIFRIVADDMRVAVVGHIYPELNDDQLEAMGTIDLLIIPVGGNGYTLDGIGALNIIKKIEPKIVIPTHYADKTIKYPVLQQELEDALKGLAMEPKETVTKLKLKPIELTDTTQLIVLERS